MRFMASVKKLLDARPDWFGETDEITVHLKGNRKIRITKQDNRTLKVREIDGGSLKVDMAQSSGDVVAIEMEDYDLK